MTAYKTHFFSKNLAHKITLRLIREVEVSHGLPRHTNPVLLPNINSTHHYFIACIIIINRIIAVTLKTTYHIMIESLKTDYCKNVSILPYFMGEGGLFTSISWSAARNRDLDAIWWQEAKLWNIVHLINFYSIQFFFHLAFY